jgi:predicted CopG family antitoxin
METTIQLEKSTVQKLKMLKEDMGLKSYNDVIVKIIPRKLPSSMFGSAPWLGGYSREDRMEDRIDRHEL